MDREARIRSTELLFELQRGDRHLDWLNQAATGNSTFTFGPRLGLVVGGLRWEGNLATAMSWAEEADETLRTIFETAPITGSDADADEIRRGLLAAVAQTLSFKRRVELARANREETWKRLEALMPAEPEDAPFSETIDVEDLALAEDLAAVRATNSAITLDNASLFQTGYGWVNIGMARIIVAHVSAWWLIPPSSDTDHEDESWG